MSTELQLERYQGAAQSLVDMFFRQRPVVTDWNSVRQKIKQREIVSSSMLHRLKTYEPLQGKDVRNHSHWVEQQIFRLALLHEAGKPMVGTRMCETCAKHPIDPLHEDSGYWSDCLHCIEEREQTPSNGSRGSCEFLKPCYNPRSHGWGLLYYWSHGRDDVFLFWLADFFPTRQAAEDATRPIHYYHEWLEIKHNDMITHCLDFEDLMPLDSVMNLKLPLTPDQLAAYIRAQIETDLAREQSVMHYQVEEAMRDHERAEDDE